MLCEGYLIRNGLFGGHNGGLVLGIGCLKIVRIKLYMLFERCAEALKVDIKLHILVERAVDGKYDDLALFLVVYDGCGEVRSVELISRFIAIAFDYRAKRFVRSRANFATIAKSKPNQYNTNTVTTPLTL